MESNLQQNNSAILKLMALQMPDKIWSLFIYLKVLTDKQISNIMNRTILIIN